MILAPQSVPNIVCVDFDKVTAGLLRHLAQHPTDIEQLSWSRFEELVALLLEESGYEVTRTKLTRDGGVDLWALQRSDLGSTLYAIDAKKYGRSKIIGPEPVRAIYGVADLAGASAGMIVTTATFGPAARQLASQYRYRISLKDCDDVSEWIRRVGRSS
jgi:HJR/Mrr/RecB family endonuclease